MTCKEFEELSGAYVLDAVTPEEREAAEAHLAQCAACTHLYQQLRSVVALLPLSVTQVEPPPSLKERVLAAIRREAAIAAQRTQQTQSATAQHIQLTRSASWATRLLVVTAVLLLALLGGMALLTFSLEQQLASSRLQLATAARQLANAEVQLANVSPHLLATIQGGPTVKGATGEMLYLPQQDITTLVMHGLPQVQGTHVYQGWLLFMSGKQITSIRSIGLFTLQGDTASVSFPGNVTSSYNTAAISLEPGPAASKNVPAGPVVAIGPVKH